MDIFYKNDTLYVNIDSEITDDVLMNLESKISSIINSYNIYNLVIKAPQNKKMSFQRLENDDFFNKVNVTIE